MAAGGEVPWAAGVGGRISVCGATDLVLPGGLGCSLFSSMTASIAG